MSEQNIQLNTLGPTYLYKKTEKLVSALYLLTSFLSDNEPVKWQLRDVGLKLLSENQSDKKLKLSYLILSFLDVCHMGGIISQMNHNILKFEFDCLIKLVEAEEKDKVKGAIFSEQSFNVTNVPAVSKGQIALSDRQIRDKSNRQTIIISLLKDKKDLGIKDIVSSFKDCSEKTIQRELASLVSNGQIIKQGEKRWSRYSAKV